MDPNGVADRLCELGAVVYDQAGAGDQVAVDLLDKQCIALKTLRDFAPADLKVAVVGGLANRARTCCHGSVRWVRRWTAYG